MLDTSSNVSFDYLQARQCPFIDILLLELLHLVARIKAIVL